jgi:hypothetical protein
MYCCLLSRRSSHPFSLLVKEEKNAQNLLVIKDKALGEKYIKNWKTMQGLQKFTRGERGK